MIKNKKLIKLFNKLILLIGVYYIAFLVVVIVAHFINMPFFEKYINLFGLIPFAIALFIIFFCPEALIVQHPIKYTFSFDFKSYRDFILFLDSSTKKIKLEKWKEQRDNVTLYTKKSNLGSWREYYIAFNFEEINESAEDAIFKMSEVLRDMTRNIKDKWISEYLCGIFICVKKENEVFHKIINEQWNIPIDEENLVGYGYIVGCSFEKENAYIIWPKVVKPRYNSGNPSLWLFKQIRKIMNFKIRNAKDKTRL